MVKLQIEILQCIQLENKNGAETLDGHGQNTQGQKESTETKRQGAKNRQSIIRTAEIERDLAKHKPRALAQQSNEGAAKSQEAESPEP